MCRDALAGQYLLRGEQIGLHVASTVGGAQVCPIITSEDVSDIIIVLSRLCSAQRGIMV